MGLFHGHHSENFVHCESVGLGAAPETALQNEPNRTDEEDTAGGEKEVKMTQSTDEAEDDA